MGGIDGMMDAAGRALRRAGRVATCRLDVSPAERERGWFAKLVFVGAASSPGGDLVARAEEIGREPPPLIERWGATPEQAIVRLVDEVHDRLTVIAEVDAAERRDVTP